MNKKIKVIELLNKIANKEELPKQIKIYGRDDSIYILRNIKDTEIYYYTNKDTHERLGADWHLDGKILNDYAEILEDEEEIDIQAIKENKELVEWPSVGTYSVENLNAVARRTYGILKEIMYTQNDLIKSVKQLDKKINKED